MKRFHRICLGGALACMLLLIVSNRNPITDNLFGGICLFFILAFMLFGGD